MKFHQLEIGQEFIYKSHRYTKLSPVLASRLDSGEQCFMKRADSVLLADESSAENASLASRDVIKGARLLREFDQFIQGCVQAACAADSDLSAAQQQRIAAAVQAKAREFRHVLQRNK